ncbi:MAG: NAD(P)H-hydrate dehydratase [Chromatiales bacterium]|nr:NAD(P)H-hydrate dehydratase [Chromatiales bacterium]
MSEADPLVFPAAAVRRLDEVAIREFGIPGYTLMQRAAGAALRAIRQRWPEARRWAILCGAGNNAGDGYVLARLASAEGIDLRVCALADPAELTQDAARAYSDFSAAGLVVSGSAEEALDAADLAVDALLGTGLDRPLEGDWLAAVEGINQFGRAAPVVALDIPTGLDAETGHRLGAAVRAWLTITFVGRKRGLYLADGPDCRGELLFDDLGIPAAALAQVQAWARRADLALLAALLPPRPASSHKGRFGHVVVVGGNTGMGGASRLAAEAALRSGAGLVSVATRDNHVALVSGQRPELMVHGVDDTAGLDTLLGQASVVAVGPGLGRDAWARDCLQRVLDSPQPKVLDADALNLLAGSPVRRDDWVLTPHPGEAARLLGWTSAQVQAQRPEALSGLLERFGGTVLLKGAGTLVARQGQLPWLVDRGNPGMASAGMGDVLTGVLAGLLAQCPDAPMDEVTAAAALAHALAGDAAAAGQPRGLLAGDLLAALRPWLNP